MDLLRYVAWLIEVRHKPRPEPEGDPYEKAKERARARNAALALAGRDIGELPEVVDPERKAQAASDFRFFCESYFPLTFHLPWSADHLKVISKIEQAVIHGGLFAMACPRGTGKSSICESACIWAVLNGHRDFVCLIGSDEGHAMDMLDAIKTELDGNDLLLADFPEVVYPIQCLDGIANRCNGQLYQGQRTHIGWTAREVVLPTMPDSPASGAIIKVAGITGRIRGMKYKRSDGKTVRPSLVVIDDPQTDESARSLSQCATREAILAGTAPSRPDDERRGRRGGRRHEPPRIAALWPTDSGTGRGRITRPRPGRLEGRTRHGNRRSGTHARAHSRDQRP